jgi:hypothetical protein
MRTLALLLALSLTACAGTRAPTYPLTVQIADLRLAEPGLLEQTIGLDLRFTNPSPEPVAVEGLRFTLDLEGGTVGTGVSDAAFVIPRLGETLVPVTVRVQTGELINRLLLIDGSSLEYRLSGDLFEPAPQPGRTGERLSFATDSAIAVPDLETLLGRVRRL